MLKEASRCILCPCFGLVTKLVGIQLWADNWEDGIQYQYRSVVIQFRGKRFPGMVAVWSDSLMTEWRTGQSSKAELQGTALEQP